MSSSSSSENTHTNNQTADPTTGSETDSADPTTPSKNNLTLHALWDTVLDQSQSSLDTIPDPIIGWHTPIEIEKKNSNNNNNTQQENETVSTSNSASTPSLAKKSELSSSSYQDIGMTQDIYGAQIKQENLQSYAIWVDHHLKVIQSQDVQINQFVMKYKSQIQTGEIVGQARKDLEKIVRNGIPPQHRAKFWKLICGVDQIIEMSKGIYKNILKDYEGKKNDSTKQIMKDIGRTFNSNVGFFTPEALKRVLVAFSFKNPHIGYCQSMNFISAGLLFFLTEEETFWVLNHLSERLLPNYFTEDLTGCMNDITILSFYLKRRLPKLDKHFKKIGLNIYVIATKWLMCLFLTTVPLETAFRFWDMIFFYGPQMIIELALKVLALNEKQLLALQLEPEIVIFLNSQTEKLFDVEKVHQITFKSIAEHKVKRMRNQNLKTQREKSQEKQQNDVKSLASVTHFQEPEIIKIKEQLEQLNLLYGIYFPSFEEIVRTVMPDWLPSPFLTRLFDLYDTDRDNIVDWPEMIRCLSAICRGSPDEKLKVCFDLFQSEKMLDREEVTFLLNSLYMLCGQSNFQREASFFVDMIFQIAKSSDDKISFAQFREGALAQPIIIKCFSLDNPKMARQIDLSPWIQKKKQIAKDLTTPLTSDKILFQSPSKGIFNFFRTKN